MAIKNDIQWTPEMEAQIEAEMPKGLLPIDQYQWRKNKMNELRAQAALSKQNSSQTAAPDSNNTEKSETNDKPVLEPLADNDLSDDETLAEEEVPHKPAAVKKAKAGAFKNPVAKKNQAECICVRGVHKSVITALDRLFPGGTSNGDMIAAAVYIVTGGDCEVTEKAMQLVESYGKREGTDISQILNVC